MRQPIINFLFYFGRFAEVKQIKTKQAKILVEINASTLIKESDKVIISELIFKLANPKSPFFISPLKTNSTQIPEVRNIQNILSTYIPLVTSEKEHKLIENTLRATNDFFRYHEMFEQNVMFWMLIIIILTIIITPIIFMFF